MGAELSVNSTPQVGTRFQVALPELPAQSAAHEVPATAAGSARA